VAAVLLLLRTAPVVAVELDLQAVDALPPAEQHRQLSLMLLVSAGVDEALMEIIDQRLGPEIEDPDGGQEAAGNAGPESFTTFDTDRYTSPLARIVDQATLLAGAEQLFRFTLDHQVAIRSRLDRLERGETSLASPQALADLTEDTILIRQAIADSLRAVDLAAEVGEPERRYRAQTVVLRNTLEYTQFKAELDVITGQAIASVGGRLDAYQRMFDVETNTGVLDRRIRSAELIYLPEGQFDPRAGELTEEMLRNMVLSESQPNN
jgi:hypothetical protein